LVFEIRRGVIGRQIFHGIFAARCNIGRGAHEVQGTMTNASDDWAGLLRAANAGDGQAYARFLHAVTPVVRGIVRARGRGFGPDQHEDIVQEVLLALHRKRHTWREDHPLRPWLYAIVRYKVVDAFRARGSAAHLPIEDFSEILAADPGADPFAARDAARQTEALLGQLDPRSAEIVRALSLREEAPAEVGARLNMTEGALRVGLHRAMKKLAALVKGGTDEHR
jgi:RNA polymerase sigma-70 factor (ECF subfamily)